MRTSLAAVVLASTFTTYMGPKAPDTRIEAITDRGPIVELIVKCQSGTTIISYSKLEQVYCDPRLRCEADRNVVIQRACG